MPRYWIVLKREREELYAALRERLRGNPDFTVIRDRRVAPDHGGGRRKATTWEGDGVVFAEERDER